MFYFLFHVCKTLFLFLLYYYNLRYTCKLILNQDTYSSRSVELSTEVRN